MFENLIRHGRRRYDTGFRRGVICGALLALAVTALSFWGHRSRQQRFTSREVMIMATLVKDFLARLAELEPDEKKRGNLPIVLSSDPEGNHYVKLSSMELMGFDAEDQEVGILELTEEDKAAGYSEEDVRGTPAIVLWP